MTFTYFEKPCFNTYRNEFEYVGTHEAVHLIAGIEFGLAKTKFFGEGYANAIDGNYGSVIIHDTIFRMRIDSILKFNNNKMKFYTPSELLHDNKISPNIYYPQIGCFMTWLFKEYGIEKINKLYTFNEKQIENDFMKITGESFVNMEEKYLTYLQNNK